MRPGFSLVLIGILAANATLAGEPARLTPRDLDALLAKEAGAVQAAPASDEQFLRRASLDLIGRPPAPAELTAFRDDPAADKRARAIDRLLASKDYGRNWANYWSDAISFRVPPPELTFLDYKPFKGWLADQFNAGVPWDQVTRDILTASGKLRDNPAGTFIGYHQGNAEKLAAETARIFLGVQIQCAQCHDHKFDHWKREQFHHLAAFFARTEGKLAKSATGPADPADTVVQDRGKGEYQMADAKDPKKKGQTLAPGFLTGEAMDLDKNDAERRELLAKLVTSPKSPWFARAYVNRVWARLMGRGFYEPVDDLADYLKPILPKVHQALADGFAASGFDTKEFFRLVMNTEAYQRGLPLDPAAKAGKLRGDEVFDSLVAALGLPNLTPPAVKPTPAVRFPPPPKSTRDLVCDKFGYDPSLPAEEVTRTMGQALLLMNNEQVQAQINADPKSGTLLSKLLQKEPDDRAAVGALFRQVLARPPTENEVKIALDHVKAVGRRGAAFEDLLWSLINSAEFTTRR